MKMKKNNEKEKENGRIIGARAVSVSRKPRTNARTRDGFEKKGAS